eukprot:m.221797 g.221797  ORF g.221797 m.221797 type:complete len:786 (+) comp22295_c0_seq1:153-2510(+)
MEKYERIKVLGKGTFGRAWLVRHLQSSELLVAKEIKCENRSDLEDALAEAKIMAQVDHANIVKFHDAIRSSSKLVIIVMEYCDDGDIAEKIARRKFAHQYFDEDLVLNWTAQLCRALEYLHSKGIMHRDIKTANLFLKKGGVLKLGDFGIARLLDRNADSMSRRTTRTPVGTPMYMSPELCQGARYGQKADMWALGCVLYEMCSLKHAYAGESLMGLLYKICEGQPPLISDYYDVRLRELAQVLMQRDPKDRPSCSEILKIPYISAHIERMRVRLSRHSPEVVRQDQQRIQAAASGSRSPLGASGLDDSGSRSSSHSRSHSAGSHSTASLSSTQGARLMTPQEKIRLRKQQEADRRAAELSNAARKQVEENSKRYAEDRRRLHSPSVNSVLHSGEPSLRQRSRHTTDTSTEGDGFARSRSSSASSQRQDADGDSLGLSRSPVSRRAASHPARRDSDPRPAPWLDEHSDIFPSGMPPEDSYDAPPVRSDHFDSDEFLPMVQAATSRSRPTSASSSSRRSPLPPASRSPVPASSSPFTPRPASGRRARLPSTNSLPSAASPVPSPALGLDIARSASSAECAPYRPSSGPAARARTDPEMLSPSPVDAYHLSPQSASGFYADDFSSPTPEKRPHSSIKSLNLQKRASLQDSLDGSMRDSPNAQYLNDADFESLSESSDDSDNEEDMQDLRECLNEILQSPESVAPAKEEEVNDPDFMRCARMAALRNQGQRLLGGKFLGVYQYLREARLNHEKDAVIRKKLQAMVERYQDAFVVDQLVYMECFGGKHG